MIGRKFKPMRKPMIVLITFPLLNEWSIPYLNSVYWYISTVIIIVLLKILHNGIIALSGMTIMAKLSTKGVSSSPVNEDI